MLARQEYLKQQRDKLLALKKQVRERRLGAVDSAESGGTIIPVHIDFGKIPAGCSGKQGASRSERGYGKDYECTVQTVFKWGEVNKGADVRYRQIQSQMKKTF